MIIHDPITTIGNTYVNPGANQVLALSPQLTAGIYKAFIIFYVTVAFDVILERRDSTNSTNIWAMNLRLQNNLGPYEFEWVIQNNEYIRIETLAGNTGSIQAGLNLRRFL